MDKLFVTLLAELEDAPTLRDKFATQLDVKYTLNTANS